MICIHNKLKYSTTFFHATFTSLWCGKWWFLWAQTPQANQTFYCPFFSLWLLFAVDWSTGKANKWAHSTNHLPTQSGYLNVGKVQMMIASSAGSCRYQFYMQKGKKSLSWEDTKVPMKHEALFLWFIVWRSQWQKKSPPSLFSNVRTVRRQLELSWCASFCLGTSPSNLCERCNCNFLNAHANNSCCSGHKWPHFHPNVTTAELTFGPLIAE